MGRAGQPGGADVLEALQHPCVGHVDEGHGARDDDDAPGDHDGGAEAQPPLARGVEVGGQRRGLAGGPAASADPADRPAVPAGRPQPARTGSGGACGSDAMPADAPPGPASRAPPFVPLRRYGCSARAPRPGGGARAASTRRHPRRPHAAARGPGLLTGFRGSGDADHRGVDDQVRLVRLPREPDARRGLRPGGPARRATGDGRARCRPPRGRGARAPAGRGRRGDRLPRDGADVRPTHRDGHAVGTGGDARRPPADPGRARRDRPRPRSGRGPERVRRHGRLRRRARGSPAVRPPHPRSQVDLRGAAGVPRPAPLPARAREDVRAALPPRAGHAVASRDRGGRSSPARSTSGCSRPPTHG